MLQNIVFFDPKIKGYVAIIGDIKQSRGSQNREEIQRMLNHVLEEVNTQYRKKIAARFVITLGDEFQGLLYDGEAVPDILLAVKEKMSPVQIRFGIGIGAITTEIIEERALGADGPAYYSARSAIEYIKKSEKARKTGKRDIYIQTENRKSGELLLLNQLLSMMYLMEASWNDNQKKAVWDMLRHRDTQSVTAQRQGMKQSSLNRMLQSVNYYSYQEAYDMIKAALSEVTYDI